MKTSYTEHYTELQKINERKEELFTAYKEKVQNVAALYARDVICLYELTLLITTLQREQSDALHGLNQMIDRLPDYDILPLP